MQGPTPNEYYAFSPDDAGQLLTFSCAQPLDGSAVVLRASTSCAAAGQARREVLSIEAKGCGCCRVSACDSLVMSLYAGSAAVYKFIRTLGAGTFCRTFIFLQQVGFAVLEVRCKARLSCRAG